MTPIARVPWALIWFRAGAAFLPWICSAFGWPMEVALYAIPLALLSDIFDGKIARRYGTVTVLLRRADGWADNAFTLSYTAFVLIARWEVLEPYLGWIIALGLFRAARAGLDFWKYGRGSAYHLYAAKAWGLAYYTFLALVLAEGPFDFAMLAVLVLGFVNTTEGIVATLMTPVWIIDAPHVFAAIKKGRQAVQNTKL
ncbi:MAG: CDP-alcohol phosphatidyltransferase family protein [Pseudomonadota bacterium]